MKRQCVWSKITILALWCCLPAFLPAQKTASVPSPAVTQTSAASGNAGVTKTASFSPGSIGLDALAKALKAEVFYDSLTGYGFFRRFGINAVFASGVPWILWDWKDQDPVPAPENEAGGIGFKPGFRAVLEKRFLALEKQNANTYSVAAILIDPGHGGKDTGAIGEHESEGGNIRLVEKELNLSIALEVYEDLKRRFPERRIILTRDRDVYPSLEERVAIANSESLEENQA
ncbi:MAG: N-acetylmuramoyl-L-alanine amidase, partial [Rectinemataceae bacterium]|nr:N-acetylmuramoyl-L-alanine amidase [Rectinemataceae bacterium]